MTLQRIEEGAVASAPALGEAEHFDVPPSHHWESQNSWTDVTEFFLEATDELDVGHLLHPEGFTLWDSMSAIEMMDPKMDPGMELAQYQPKNQLKVADIAEQFLSSVEIIGILDELLSREMSWIAGNFLCQTLFTCIYLHDPHKIPHPVLYACAVAILRTADGIIRMVSDSKIADEEDFAPETMGFSLCEEVPQGDAVAALLDVEENLAFASAGDTDIEAISSEDWAQLGVSPREKPEILDALLCRVRFRRAFYSMIESINNRDRLRAQKCAADGMRHLELIERTMDIGCDVDNFFDPFITRKLFTTAPPKPISVMPKKQAMDDMATLLSHVHDVCSQPAGATLTTQLSFLESFSARKPAPSVLARACLHNIVLNPTSPSTMLGALNLIKLALKDFFEHRDAAYSAEMLHQFLGIAQGPVDATLKLYCKNRSRQHRGLRKVILSWDQLQVAIQTLEAQSSKSESPARTTTMFSRKLSPPYPSFALSLWVYHQKLLLMILYLQLGYELDLYASYEHLMVLWHIRALLHELSVVLMRVSQGGASIPDKDRHWHVTLLRIETEAKTKILDGLLYLGRHYYQQGFLAPPRHKAYREDTHFEHRFRAFATLSSPARAKFQDFTAWRDERVDATKVFAAAEECLAKSKTALQELILSAKHDAQASESSDYAKEDRMKELQSMTRVCIANSLVIKREGSSSAGQKTKVSLGECKYHPHFPVFVVHWTQEESTKCGG
ncbi:Mak10 subunit, NatC N-terminal acetyltransferase-domain-containing protein [Fimicolochytrium jonesii]|uniref:Mak10 subunit, NatC N-terminal acetyltransferase-domain-containing protein n=1 Tax=Fimicolochytrium jonesii TaxID=1396493 RepID=UPI0022FDE82C|nr:Mak10 subunit, NatC N-terminal acetyltransferase-domain-containing protein [Fimicolochytrium jonesii]KAI8822605.1 Mak10 subunit, NatC N-terminal acetyltransferase-domain-containing protein [Fimicolochytrium jonesii]